jgi:hypothetical protein
MNPNRLVKPSPRESSYFLSIGTYEVLSLEESKIEYLIGTTSTIKTPPIKYIFL